jgi:hypothetical protein
MNNYSKNRLHNEDQDKKDNVGFGIDTITDPVGDAFKTITNPFGKLWKKIRLYVIIGVIVFILLILLVLFK